jgi:hypothetical protein
MKRIITLGLAIVLGIFVAAAAGQMLHLLT